MYYSNTVLRNTESFNNNRANAYVVNEIMNATPQQLLIKVYDFAIAQCKRKNIEKTNRALTELISALRYETKDVNEVSLGLKKLYEFCQDQTRKRNFDIVEDILSELKKTWIDAFSR